MRQTYQLNGWADGIEERAEKIENSALTALGAESSRRGDFF